MSDPLLYLASNSPRRHELLALTGLDFHSFPVDADETQLSGEPPADYVLRLAVEKARLADERARQAGVSPRWILSADTTVVDVDPSLGEVILGKPQTPQEAQYMLQRLRGRSHQVYTALALLDQSDGRLLSDLCVTQVCMRDYTDAEIHEYVLSGDPVDKAGAYAIQHPQFHPVESIQGCYTGVMGLSLCRLAYLMEQMGLQSKVDIAQICLSSHDDTCPPILSTTSYGEQRS